VVLYYIRIINLLLVVNIIMALLHINLSPAKYIISSSNSGKCQQKAQT